MEQTKNVLIIEDCQDIQILLTRLLKKNGYTVDCANEGQQAINFLCTTEKIPGVILLDLMMPVMDGAQFRQEQEKITKIATIPVIVMTADNNAQNKSIELKAQGFLKKPFLDINIILKTIENFFPKSDPSKN